LFGSRADAETIPHTLCQLQRGLPRLTHQLITGNTFLLVEMQQFLLENLVGQRGLDFFDALSVLVRLPRRCRPYHHMDVGMIAL